jgi:hypothetical protein
MEKQPTCQMLGQSEGESGTPTMALNKSSLLYAINSHKSLNENEEQKKAKARGILIERKQKSMQSSPRLIVITSITW